MTGTIIFFFFNPLHFSISCHWSNSLEWKLVKRPFRIHEPECLNLFYFKHIWIRWSDMCSFKGSLFQLETGKRSFRGILYISWKSTNDCWVVDSTWWIQLAGFDTEFTWIIYEYNVAESVRMFSVRLKMLFKTPRELWVDGLAWSPTNVYSASDHWGVFVFFHSLITSITETG